MELEGRFDVVWPLGHSRVEEVAANARLDDLSDKTIAFVWDYLFKGPEMFELIQEHLLAEFPGIRFIDYPVFGNIHGAGSEERENLDAMADRLRDHGVDAAVVAVGA